MNYVGIAMEPGNNHVVDAMVVDRYTETFSSIESLHAVNVTAKEKRVVQFVMAWVI